MHVQLYNLKCTLGSTAAILNKIAALFAEEIINIDYSGTENHLLLFISSFVKTQHSSHLAAELVLEHQELLGVQPV